MLVGFRHCCAASYLLRHGLSFRKELFGLVVVGILVRVLIVRIQRKKRREKRKRREERRIHGSFVSIERGPIAQILNFRPQKHIHGCVLLLRDDGLKRRIDTTQDSDSKHNSNNDQHKRRIGSTRESKHNSNNDQFSLPHSLTRSLTPEPTNKDRFLVLETTNHSLLFFVVLPHRFTTLYAIHNQID